MSSPSRDAGRDKEVTGAPGRAARPDPAGLEPPAIPTPGADVRGYGVPGALHSWGHEARGADPLVRGSAPLAPKSFVDTARAVAEQVKERIRVALAKASTWWASHKHLTGVAALPKSAAEAVLVLRTEEGALATREQEWEASAKRREARAEKAAAELRDLERQAAAERERLAALAAAAMREAAEREAAARALTEAEAAVAATRLRRDAVQVAITRAEKASASGKARVSRAEKRAKKDATAAQAAATAGAARQRTDAIIREATYPIVWVREAEIAGVRTQPVGMFDQAVPMAAPHSRVVGGLGKLGALVDWSHCEALEVAATILDAQRVPSSKRGRPVKHVAHGVLSKPNDGTRAVQHWTGDTAMRAARHYLVGQGADPDRHDAVVFVHSQVAQRGDGAVKVEEAVHVLWSRVRDDGALFDIDHAFVAAAVSRARYDVAAGIDPQRIGMASGKSKPVRDGLTALKKRELGARYREPGSMRTLERIPLQGRDHAHRLGAEGHPEAGDIAGTWTPKPGYRGADETRRILSHLMAGD